MKKILLLTGNERKMRSFAKVFEGKDVAIEMSDIWLPELQAETNAEVASYAAKYGAELLQCPVVKMDSGFYIDGLNGFPGALVRYADRQIGAERFFPIVESLAERGCSIQNILAYCEPGKEPRIFLGGSQGELIYKAPDEFRGSFIDELYVPHHPLNTERQTMGELRAKDHDLFLLMWGNAEREFADWFTK